MTTDATPAPLLDTMTAIAYLHFAIHTLEERNSDRLDFYDLHVTSIRSALEAAYARGHADATAALTTNATTNATANPPA